MPDLKRLDDGFQTLIHFQNNPTVKFYERDVTPPGYSTGPMIDTTNMRNRRLRTMSFRKLKSLTPVQATVQYMSDVMDPDEVWAMLGVNQQITIEYPDNSFLQFWGGISDFIPSGASEGNLMTASITVQPTNQNNDAPPLEVDPKYTAPVSVTPPAPFYDYDAVPTAVAAAGDE